MVVGVSILLGVVGAYLTKIIDSSMDYGHIFDFVRKRHARRLDKDGFYDVQKELVDQSLHAKITTTDKYYWQLWNKTEDKRFLSVLCIKCMTLRITLLIALLFSLILCIKHSLCFLDSILLIVGISTISLASSYYTLIKTNE